MDMTTATQEAHAHKPVTELEAVTVRLAGDSGDGMQLAGMQLTDTSGLCGNDIATFPDYPAEIRAPHGSLAGVSGFQIQFAAKNIYTAGDRIDTLIALNPAGLKANLTDLKSQGILIVDEDAFDPKGLKLAGYTSNPLDGSDLDDYRLIRVPITTLTRSAVKDTKLGRKLAKRCRNFFTLGLVYWLYSRSLEPTLNFITNRFKDDQAVADADRQALLAGWNYGDTTEALSGSYHVCPADLAPGTYRNLTGNQALAYGLITAAKRSGKALFYGSYPITPASSILHELSRHKRFGVRTFQAEDEIAAATSAIGAAFAGAIAATASSGPGMALKSEALGLAVMLELPLIVIDVQRAGPSTGLPTKPEQSDLLQALFGRSGEAPLPILAVSSPADGFSVIQDAWRIAARLMTPVIVLSDAHIANGAEPWRIPEAEKLEEIRIRHPDLSDVKRFMPYNRDELLARPWALPGTEGLMHRIGGLEKQDITGNVSYDQKNHEHMVRLRARKVENAVNIMPAQELMGAQQGRLLILSWGGSFGACAEAVSRIQQLGLSVGHAHLRYLNPLPANLGDILSRFEQILIPELNTGQLNLLIKARFSVDCIKMSKINSRPFSTTEIFIKIKELLHAK
jgi:2-oxoglutarate ferredoxin oxidoreductase subunit alpha